MSYAKKKLVIAERYKFYSAQQEPNEDIKSFAAKLKSLTKSCEFGTFLNEALRDRLVCEIRSETVKQRLLRKSQLGKSTPIGNKHGSSRGPSPLNGFRDYNSKQNKS